MTEATEDRRVPRVAQAAWTFELSGECVYCGKKCTRSRTFKASTLEAASEKADRAASDLCHRKCGGY